MAGELPEIVYRDERIVVVNKPEGLLSVPGIGAEKADCVASRVSAWIPGARIVHRLDRDTSGVMVMALDVEAHRQLSVQFQDRVVKKVYVAMTAGVMEEDEGMIDMPIRKDMEHPPRQMVDYVHGRASATAWRVLERGEDRTRVELKPRTGRSHQLRLHMKSVGHPILGDDLYAPAEVVAMAERLMLHAWSLSLVHPGTSAWMRFEVACCF